MAPKLREEQVLEHMEKRRCNISVSLENYTSVFQAEKHAIDLQFKKWRMKQLCVYWKTIEKQGYSKLKVKPSESLQKEILKP